MTMSVTSQMDESLLLDYTEEDETSQLSDMDEELMEMEEEVRKLKEIQNGGKLMKDKEPQQTVELSEEEKAVIDGKSVYVGNVDYGVSTAELEQHFHGCGAITRITIPTDKFKKPKGFAYIEFSDKESMEISLGMSDSLLRGRQIKVMEKRTNKRGMSTTNRYAGMRGRGGGRGGMRGGPRGGSRGITKVVYVMANGYRGRGRGRPF